MQAIWQESATTVIDGEAHGSSLVKDELRSGLNALLVRWLKNGSFPHVNFLEVNNVCDGGAEIRAELLSRLPTL